MSGIALVQYGAPITTLSQLILDNGLARLAACARRSGHDAVILDFLTVDRVRRPADGANGSDVEQIVTEIDSIVTARDLGVVGFKLWSGEAYRAASEAVRLLRARRPGLKIIGGGPHVDYFGERILKDNPGFDLLVRGEGERPLVMILDALDRQANLMVIPNLIFVRDGRIVATPGWEAVDLDAWPRPDYTPEIYPAAIRDRKIKIAILETSRGCPFACSFCGHGRKSGRRTRSRRPEAIVDEMESLARGFGISRFRSGDSNTPPALTRGIAREIVSRKFDASWTLIGRADVASEYGLPDLPGAGCRSVFYGLESASPVMLERAYNKRHTPVAARDAILAARDAGLFTIVSLIAPGPHETRETLDETFRFLLDTRPDAVNVCMPIVNPGTAWGDEPDRFGIEIPEGYFDRTVGVTPSLLYPIDRWQETAVRIGGRDAAEMKRIASDFETRLEAEGLLTQVIDDIAMMAEAAGATPREFRDLTRLLFDRGDRDALSEIVRRINRGSRMERREC